MKKISVVVCVLNEELNIKPLISAVKSALVGYDYELIYVDDGSKDGTIKEILSANDPNIKLIELKKNYGQSSALAAGIEHATGEFIVTMDGDLQNDPSDIPMMLHLAESEGWDLVAGTRANRQDSMFIRKIPSKIANSIIRMTTGVYIKDYGCTLKLFRNDIAKGMGLYGELHRYIPVLAHLEGATITQVDVKHHARQFGTSKYGINRTFKVMSDLILVLFLKKYLQKPMHLFGTAGIISFFLGVLINMYLFIVKITGHDIGTKPLLILGAILLLAGIQLVSIGIFAELQMRTYYEAQDKKPYKIKRIIGGE